MEVAEQSPLQAGAAALSGTAELQRLSIFSAIDHQFAETVAGIFENTPEEVALGAGFASWAVQNGNVCAELARILDRRWTDREGAPLHVKLPTYERWVDTLRNSPLVALADGERTPARPLVLDRAGRLYLHRYFVYEQRLLRQIQLRQVPAAPQAHLAPGPDAGLLRASLDRLLPSSDPSSKEQRLAALLALLKRFSVISGGPGTGKTYTVAKVLIVLQEQARAQGKPFLKIELLAPTGKAAQRLGEAIAENLAARGERACSPEIAEHIPRQASTVHRRLGFQPRTPTQFKHNAKNPLRADVVVVDEASMVDAALMAKLMDAVEPTARLILLGDKNQLASVEAGAILGDIYAPGGSAGYSRALAAEILALTGDVIAVSESAVEGGPQDHMVHLEHSRRFPEGGGIKSLADAVNRGDADAALALFQGGERGTQSGVGVTRGARSLRSSVDRQVHLQELPPHANLVALFGDLIEERYAPIHQASPLKKLEMLSNFRFLCAHREGPLGVKAVNALVQEVLAERGYVPSGSTWYPGRPVIINANDYQVGLFNGDVGVLAAEDGSTEVAALFSPSGAADESNVRAFSPARLPAHETVYAMSVHKSQGSELAHVALLLPPRVSPVLTRELVYTAITRAKQSVTIYGTDAVLRAAVQARVLRASGLRDALWGLDVGS